MLIIKYASAHKKGLISAGQLPHLLIAEQCRFRTRITHLRKIESEAQLEQALEDRDNLDNRRLHSVSKPSEEHAKATSELLHRLDSRELEDLLDITQNDKSDSTTLRLTPDLESAARETQEAMSGDPRAAMEAQALATADDEYTDAYATGEAGPSSAAVPDGDPAKAGKNDGADVGADDAEEDDVEALVEADEMNDDVDPRQDTGQEDPEEIVVADIEDEILDKNDQPADPLSQLM